MMRRMLIGTVVAILILVGSAGPASAQQGVTFNLGGVLPRSEDARVQNDVLNTNLNYLVFDISDFNGVTVGGDWSLPLGDYFEAAVGVSYYQHSVPTIYDDWVNNDGSEIEQTLKLRNIPLTAMVRILPLGAKRNIQPYVAAGLGVNMWRYSETGEFVDLYDNSIFRDNFVQSGTAVGPVAAFGVRGRFAPKASIGMEFRWQWAEANLSTDFLSDKLDLGGFSILSSFTYRF
jgi:hypothetical protein